MLEKTLGNLPQKNAKKTVENAFKNIVENIVENTAENQASPPVFSSLSSLPVLPIFPAKGSVLCFDFGVKRIGVATGEIAQQSAHPLCIIHSEINAERFAQIDALIKEWQPVFVIVGIPVSPEGEAHEMSARARRFANQLRGRFKLIVQEADERYTSIEAAERLRESGMSAQKMKAHLDAVAAQIILEGFWESLPKKEA